MLITPEIHRITGFVNQYLLIEKTGYTLIDTGMQSNMKNIEKYFEKNNLDPKKLKRILITHSDSDHYGAAQSLQTATGAELWASKIEAEAMKSGSSSRPIEPKGIFKVIFPLIKNVLQSPPTTVDHFVQDGDILPIFGGLQVIASPGHTPGHISFFLPEEKILFAGDAITASKKKPVPTTDGTTGDPEQACNSFEKLMHLSPKVICCGHAYFDLRI